MKPMYCYGCSILSITFGFTSISSEKRVKQFDTYERKYTTFTFEEFDRKLINEYLLKMNSMCDVNVLFGNLTEQANHICMSEAFRKCREDFFINLGCQILNTKQKTKLANMEGTD